MIWSYVVILGVGYIALVSGIGLMLRAVNGGPEEEPMQRPVRELKHSRDLCTGTWELAGAGGGRRLMCTHCDGDQAATPENRLAAIDENYAGKWLHLLATVGAEQLEAER